MSNKPQKIRSVVKPRKGENPTYVIQSWILTSARYNFSVYEKRILYRIVEYLQYMVKDKGGKLLRDNINIETEIFGDYVFTVPISEFLNGEEDKNHDRIKKALISLRDKAFEYEDESTWEYLGIIENPKITKYAETATFRVTERLFEAFLSFASGYKKFELDTVFQFESTYAMRFYELFAGQHDPITYSIETLKEMFSIVGKYKNPSDFITYVIKPAKKELDKKSPFSFTYETDRDRGESRKMTKIYFTIVMTKNEPQKAPKPKVSAMFKVERYLLKLLQDHHGFTTQTLTNNADLIADAERLFGVMDFLQKVDKNAEKKGKTIGSGYKINALKNEVAKHTANG